MRDRGGGAHELVLRLRAGRARARARAGRGRRAGRPSRSTVSVTSCSTPSRSSARRVDGVADGRASGQAIADQAGDRLVVLVLGQHDADRLARSRPGAAGRRAPSCRRGSRRAGSSRGVVLVAHLADDLLDEVLERHEAVDVAELVDDDAICSPPARSVSSRSSSSRVDGTSTGRTITVATGRVAALLERHADGVLDVHDAGERRRPAADDGEARPAGRARLLDHRRHRVVLGDRGDATAGRHHVVRPALAERQRALAAASRCRAPACPARPSGGRASAAPPASAPRRAPPAARSRSAAGSRWPVPLKDRHDRPGGAGEAAQEALDRARRLQRRGDREVLRHELAEDHRHAGGEDRARSPARRPGRHPPGTPTDSSGPSTRSAIAGSAMKPISRLVTRDADLRRRELRRQAAQRGLHAARAHGRRPRRPGRPRNGRRSRTRTRPRRTRRTRRRARARAGSAGSRSYARPPPAGGAGRAWDYSWGRRSSTDGRSGITGSIGARP